MAPEARKVHEWLLTEMQGGHNGMQCQDFQQHLLEAQAAAMAGSPSPISGQSEGDAAVDTDASVSFKPLPASPLVAGAPVEVQPDELQLSFQMQRQAAFDAVPLDPRSCPGPGVKLCMYRRWFSRPAHQVCPVYWEVPMSTAKLQRILRFRMGSHLLPIEQGRHLRLPRHRRVCRLCHTGALGDERHMLLECPALADLRDEYSPLVAECSGVMARLVWARNQPMVSRYIIACLDRMSC